MKTFKTFKSFLNESYSKDAQELLNSFIEIAKTLNTKKVSDIEYNVIDKEYFIEIETKKNEYELYINRDNLTASLINQNTGEIDTVSSVNDLNNYLK